MTFVVRVNRERVWGEYLVAAEQMKENAILGPAEAQGLLDLVMADLGGSEANEVQWLLCQLVGNAGRWEPGQGETRDTIGRRVARAREWLQKCSDWTLEAEKHRWGSRQPPVYQMKRVR